MDGVRGGGGRGDVVVATEKIQTGFILWLYFLFSY